jgi:hypothetical protein
MIRRRQLEVQERVRERREREDAAPRLRDQVTELVSLSIEVDDHFGSDSGSKTRYVRHVVVERAPALFRIPCSDPGCSDGGHDVTTPVMRALRAGESEFSGQDVCGGWRNGEHCGRVLHYTGHAVYRWDTPQPKDQ